MTVHVEPDIIVAVSSAAGHGRRGVVRLSGLDGDRGLPGRLAPHVRLAPLPGDPRPWDRADDAPRGVVRAWLHEVPGVPAAMPCLALVLRGPASYTGEDGLELYPPGSPALLEAVAAGLVSAGRTAGVAIGRAGPGHFSLRAWRNGRLDLVEAEAVSMLIAAGDHAELEAARALSGGTFVAEVDDLAADLAAVLAQLEAGIDFADEEDVVVAAAGEIAECVDAQFERLDRLRRAGGRREHGLELPRVMLAGEPNAGKSTLFNALLGRDAALASPLAGTTRDVLEVPWRIHGTEVMVVLADAAGIAAGGVDGVAAGGGERGGDPVSGVSPPAGVGSRSIDAAAQKRAAESAASADVLLLCVPVDRPVIDPLADVDRPEESVRPAHPGQGQAPVLIVRTMLDRLGNPPDRRRAVDHARGDAWVSAATGVGLESVSEAIAGAAETAAAGAAAGLLGRHRAAIQRAWERVAEARALLERDRQRDPAGSVAMPELVAALLRSGLDEIGSISGARSADDVLGLVFGSFCIGK